MSNRHISVIIKGLESAWKDIQRQYPDVPDVALYVANGEGKKLGHFGPGERWIDRASSKGVPEVMIAGDGLKLGTKELLDTLLHEAAHAANAAKGVEDTSRQGRYHNVRFKERAEAMGLEVVKSKSHGWNVTTLTLAAAEIFEGTLADLERAVNLYQVHVARRGPAGGAEDGGEGEEGEGEGKGSANRQLRAECKCKRVLRASRKVLEGPVIMCGGCLSPFLADGVHPADSSSFGQTRGAILGADDEGEE